MNGGKAALGFRTKTGRAIAVALAATQDQPSFLLRQQISLVDPRIPETGQPYHVVMELPWPEATSAAAPFVAAIERVASSELATLLARLRSMGFDVDSIGVVGSPDRSLERIGNPHIRAHGAEGMLFRRALETAASRNGVAALSFSDRTFPKSAGAQLPRLEVELKRIGRDAGRPWRSDEKSAATAAWLALTL